VAQTYVAFALWGDLVFVLLLLLLLQAMLDGKERTTH
jgi:hypothetical protein